MPPFLSKSFRNLSLDSSLVLEERVRRRGDKGNEGEEGIRRGDQVEEGDKERK